MLKSFKALAVSSFLACVPFAAQAGSDQQETVKEVLVIVSSPSRETQGMAMVLSNTMAQKGARVNVLLCDQAGDLALKSYEAEPLKPKNVTPGQMLRGLIKQGGSAKVCALYLPNSGHSKDDLIEGVGVAMPPEMADQMLNPEIRTFTF